VKIEENLRHLALYRLRQAEESVDEARYLFEGIKSPRSVVNRAYYAMFYAVLGLLIFEPYSSSKHSGILSYFNRKFIKTEKISKDLGRAVNRAFDLRQRTDYREEFNISRDQAEPFIEWAEMFVSSVKLYLKDNNCI
jgi:uncharacterized protein (UPF0332 family)